MHFYLLILNRVPIKCVITLKVKHRLFILNFHNNYNSRALPSTLLNDNVKNGKINNTHVYLNKRNRHFTENGAIGSIHALGFQFHGNSYPMTCMRRGFKSLFSESMIILLHIQISDIPYYWVLVM